MSQNPTYRLLELLEIRQLEQQGCTSGGWFDVRVQEGFRPERVRRTHFAGRVFIGALDGQIEGKPAGLYDACINSCIIGAGVRIAHVRVHLSHYDIGAGACIEDVGRIETRPYACFGNGVRAAVLNEAGGREVTLLDTLDAQIAYLMAIYRGKPLLVETLQEMIVEEAAAARSSRGSIGAGAQLSGITHMVDVRVGPHARIVGASSLTNGTVLSSAEAPTTIGPGVVARDFIVSEGATVEDGAILIRTFIGQACRVGKQFSATDSLLFANCEAFHSEVVSIFAGPYTVTHHRSTLLIAGLFSFFNAGSGTNESNHRYKLGPVHEGKLERGCKTGSGSYLMWPCRVGPFSIVLSKHSRAFDTADFPFSIIEATPEGRSFIIPGFNLATAGTLRDSTKWPTRDHRRGHPVRDRICFDLLNPFTVGRMMHGDDRLEQLQQTTPDDVETLSLGGVEIKRVLIARGRRYYRLGIELYLLEQLVTRLENNLAPLQDVLATSPDAVCSDVWVDVAGLLVPQPRLQDLFTRIERRTIETLAEVKTALDTCFARYPDDVWAWVHKAYHQVFGVDLHTAGPDDLLGAIDLYGEKRTRFLEMVLADARHEFDETARVGFGPYDGSDGVEADFLAVRGSSDDHSFIRQIRTEIEELGPRLDRLKQQLDRMLHPV